MQPVAARRFGPVVEISKLLMMIASYLPYAVLREAEAMGNARWLLVGIGAYLCVAMLVRNLALESRLPEWGRWVWLAFDYALWWFGQSLNHWDIPTLFAGFAMMADATLMGWRWLRGLIAYAMTGSLLMMGPFMAGAREGRNFWVHWFVVLAPAMFLIYGMVYLACRMLEERDEANRARKEAELANAHLREYAGQVEDLAVLRERNRLAREVHDTVAHGFTGMIMQLEAVTRLMKKHPDQAEQALLAVQDQARDSLAEIRRSVHALRPLQMENRKGVAALKRLVEEYSGTTGVKTDLVVEGIPVELPAGHDLCLYRTAQEGLTNAFRHGRATRARLRVTFTPDAVIAIVEDNGRTLPPSYQPGLGIVGIRERAEVLGGKVQAGPAATGGFVLQLTLPLTQPGGAVTA